MLLVSYDISNDKVRTKFSRYLSKFGFRLQYSMFQIQNSPRMLAIIIAEIQDTYGKLFEQTDSVLIFDMSKQCKKYSFGYAKNEDEDLIIVE